MYLQRSEVPPENTEDTEELWLAPSEVAEWPREFRFKLRFHFAQRHAMLYVRGGLAAGVVFNQPSTATQIWQADAPSRTLISYTSAQSCLSPSFRSLKSIHT
jgi:hypothetical protein